MMTFFCINQWRNITGNSLSCQRLRKAAAKKRKKTILRKPRLCFLQRIENNNDTFAVKFEKIEPE
jgi:hypothetical protein